jgi:fructokinase
VLHGARHPEMGHILPARHPDDVEFAGICPFHGACLEGLASGPAIKARWSASLSELGAGHPSHDIIAFYLAQLVVAQQALLSPDRIVFGGGVTNAPGLLDCIRHHSERLSAGYFGTEDYTRLIVAPTLGERAGLLGGLALALKAKR